MFKTLILNDCHLGVKRQAGTTEKSRAALEEYQLQEFEKLLNLPFNSLIIAGDLFDKRNVEEHIMERVIELLRNKDCMIVLGNHDLGGKFDNTLSSAEFVARLTKASIIKEPTYIESMNLYIVPHLFSQTEFDKAIANCPDNCTMLTHCNIDSGFATGDHSLNLTLEQINKLGKVIAAHEHHQRQYHNVTVLGNQFPSSIADCQGPAKRAMYLDGTEVETWDGSDYKKFLYTDEFESTSARFIEITGLCQPGEITDITKRILKFRNQSEAFIIKNSVKVQQKEERISIEAVTHFNIIELFLEALPESTRKKVIRCV